MCRGGMGGDWDGLGSVGPYRPLVLVVSAEVVGTFARWTLIWGEGLAWARPSHVLVLCVYLVAGAWVDLAQTLILRESLTRAQGA